MHGDVVRIENGRETRRGSPIPIWLMIPVGTPVFHLATFVPKTAYDRIGAFETSYKIAMDYDLILRVYRAGIPFVRVPVPLAGFRGGGLSDRKPLDGFREVRRSQLANGLNRPLVEPLHAARTGVRKYVRPLLGIK